ncbi:virulence factor family protein [Allorhizobium pseudoryzae]|uniref:virulence factor family protein n=1 Tax=Allorhizobium pseudoryzae TaxID=379684 RepID=UPI003D07408E
MMGRLLLASSLLAGLLGATPGLASDEYATKTLPITHLALPAETPEAVILLISDGDGWTADEVAETEHLLARKAAVMGVDLREWYARLSAAPTVDCHYLVSDIESLSQQIHRRAGIETYRAPVVAGIGDGAALALAIAAQTPAATIDETLAVDPTAVIPLTPVLCTPAPKTPAPGGTIYGLTPGALPNPVTIDLGDSAPPEGRALAAALKASHPDVEVAEGGAAPAFQRLAERLDHILERLQGAHTPLDLPIVPMETRPLFETMAIIYSGDGGWRDIDKKLATSLQQDGVPVVGVDALRYFWRERSPDETAADLARIIDTYRKRWRVKHVALIGYSFGANILPATLKRLPKAEADRVSLLSLLALGHQADFQISVMGWLGVAGAGKHGDPVEDLKSLKTDLVQCIYGQKEVDTACPAVRSLPGAEVIERPGGHHFDGNYKIIADAILARIRRTAAMD